MTYLWAHPTIPAKRQFPPIHHWQVSSPLPIIKSVGEGSTGAVHRAHDEQLDRDIAIRVLPFGTLADTSRWLSEHLSSTYPSNFVWSAVCAWKWRETRKFG